MGECRFECPAKYTNVNPINGSTAELMCFDCTVECLMECDPTEINSMKTAEWYRGCQKVTGNLVIRIQSGIVGMMKTLERYLGDIEVINGYLKISRSPGIKSLSFLRSLRQINGFNLFDSKYSLILLSNDNLKTIWNFVDMPGLRLERGSLLFYDNSKLCLREVADLQRALKTNVSADYVSTQSNGYEEICAVEFISSIAEVLNSTDVRITWERFKLSELCRMVGYTIFYIEAPERNVTHDGVNVCAT